MKFLYVITIMLVAASCAKHAGDRIETAPSALLTISRPTAGQLLKTGDSIQIVALATATAVIHGYELYLTRQNDTTRICSLSVHDHNDTLIIDRRLQPQPKGGYEAHILLKLDHEGHTLHKQVRFATE
ncbi:hypothetical protein [Sediminibacterium soli]|uniref:hypothetical protein n=1 Tax=Sediminibacterium soli TaxID=2698829 RepID=UPI001379C342|nr:hypothetical protein [Sediminibacterium soli]NCI45671.1 hypothetical protein [Sediminibacterium soli]